MAAETGPSPNNRPDAIEIELDETPTKLPAPLQPTALGLELDLGGATVGEIEVTIEGVPLEEDAASRDSELSGLDPAVRAVLRPPPGAACGSTAQSPRLPHSSLSLSCLPTTPSKRLTVARRCGARRLRLSSRRHLALSRRRASSPGAATG